MKKFQFVKCLLKVFFVALIWYFMSCMFFYFFINIPYVPFVLMALLSLLTYYLFYNSLSAYLIEEHIVDKKEIESIRWLKPFSKLWGVIISIGMFGILLFLFIDIKSTAQILLVRDGKIVEKKKVFPDKEFSVNSICFTPNEEGTYVVNLSKDTLLTYVKHYGSISSYKGEIKSISFGSDKPDFVCVVLPDTFSLVKRIDCFFEESSDKTKNTDAYVLTKYSDIPKKLDLSKPIGNQFVSHVIVVNDNDKVEENYMYTERPFTVGQYNIVPERNKTIVVNLSNKRLLVYIRSFDSVKYINHLEVSRTKGSNVPSYVCSIMPDTFAIVNRIDCVMKESPQNTKNADAYVLVNYSDKPSNLVIPPSDKGQNR